MTDDELISKYLRKSYFAVDGLWFMKVEEHRNFEEALVLDKQVWHILGKIQARRTIELLGIQSRTLGSLVASLQVKFDAEEYRCRINDQEPGHIEIEISECPWIELLKKANRMEFAAQIADAICPTDFSAWAREFDKAIEVKIPKRMCSGDPACLLILDKSEPSK